jgi:hypothetical protein
LNTTTAKELTMAITTGTAVVLEPASQEFVDATSTPPFLYELTPAETRKVLDDVRPSPSTSCRSRSVGSPFRQRSAT